MFPKEKSRATWIVKIVLAVSMAMFLFLLPVIPTAYPDVQVVTITIIPKEGK